MLSPPLLIKFQQHPTTVFLKKGKEDMNCTNGSRRRISTSKRSAGDPKLWLEQQLMHYKVILLMGQFVKKYCCQALWNFLWKVNMFHGLTIVEENLAMSQNFVLALLNFAVCYSEVVI
jgi:hypothetical protein